MIRKESRYTGAMLGWALLVGAAFVLLYSGQAEPLVSPRDLPRPLWLSGAVAGGAILAGWGFLLHRQEQSWRAMGLSAGLTPDESSTGLLEPFAKPDLAGVVDGRPVRVRAESRTVYKGSSQSSSTVTSTVVEAELEGPADEGVVIGRTGPGKSPDRTKFGRLWLPNAPVDDRFVAVGGSADLAESVLTPRAREALLATDAFGTLLVGNALESAKDHVDAMAEEESWGNLHVDAFDDVLYDDPSTVGSQLNFVLLDVDELARQLEAVVATARAFEDRSGGSADA